VIETSAADLKRARLNAKLTVTQAAEALGVVRTAVIAWEDGRASPTVPRLHALAGIYGVDPMSLMSFKEGVSELAKLRVAAGLLQKDVANSIGVTSTYYGAVERGIRPVRRQWIPALSKALKTTPEVVEAAIPRRLYISD